METKKELDKYRISEFYSIGTRGLFNPSAELEKGKDGNSERLKYDEIERKIAESGMKVITTDVVPRQKSYYEKHSNFMTVLSSAPLFAKRIFCNIAGKNYKEAHDEWLKYALTTGPKEFRDYRVYKPATPKPI